jgi:hypothetical protein
MMLGLANIACGPARFHVTVWPCTRGRIASPQQWIGSSRCS